MEDFSHSHRSNKASATLSKKISNGNGLTAKNVYDDVFGGQPRVGVPTFSSRVEDYCEIFGSFHTSRGSSIPILDLPVVHEGDVSIDVRNSKFDYTEVFGGFIGSDFADSYEELFSEPKGGESSSDEAWTPAETGSPSEGSDSVACSEKNQCFANGASHHSFDGVKQFNMSYHKTNQSSKEDGTNGTTHIAQLNAVPGFTYVVDEITHLLKPEGGKPLPQVINNPSLDMDFSGGIMEGKHFRKTMSHPTTCSAGIQTSGSDVKPQRGFDRNGSYPNEMFLTIPEVSLRTRPSQMPPPSRPPPKLAIEQGDSKRSTNSNLKTSKSNALEGVASDCSPPFFDVEVDASSSAAASAIAMKEAMEKAQARLKSAKELMQRKRGGIHSRMKLGLKDDLKGKERRESKTSDEGNRFKEERTNDICERDDSEKKAFAAEERQQVIRTAQVAPDFKETGRVLNVSKDSVEKKHGKESRSTQGSNRQEEAGEWKAAKQFYELVKTDKFRAAPEAFEQAQNEKRMMQTTNAHGREHNEKKAAKEAFEQKEENGNKLQAAKGARERENERKLNAVKEAQVLEESENQLKEAYEQKENEKKLKEAHDRDENKQKLKAARKQEENEKRLKEAREREENEKRQNEAREQEEKEKRVKEALEREENKKRLKEARELEENEKRVKEAREREENEKQRKESWERKENEKRLKEAREREENEKRLKEAHEQEENEKRVKEAREREEIEKQRKEAREREENEKRLKEAREREENEKKRKEAREREENEKKRKEAQEREENEKRLKEVREQEENERKQKEAWEREENEKRRKEAREREENEKRLKEVREREENEKKQKEAWEREENEKRLKEARERKENEKILKEACERKENEKREAREREENEKKQKEAREREENEKMLKEAREREENEKKLKEVREWEENEKKLKEAREREENEKRLKEAPDQVENEKKIKVAHEHKEEKNLMAANESCKCDENKNLKVTEEACRHEENNRKLKVTQEELAHEENVKIMKAYRDSCEPKLNEKDLKAAKVVSELDEIKRRKASGFAQVVLEHEDNENKMKDTTLALLLDDNGKKLSELNAAIGRNQIEKNKKASKVASDQEKPWKKLAHERGENGKNVEEAQVASDQAENMNKFKEAQVVRTWVENGKKMEAAQPTNMFEGKGNTQKIVKEIKTSQSTERKEKNFVEKLPMEGREKDERVQRERELEKERLRKIEEEGEREREREKDRMAVERATREARERTERAAVERATAEARQRAMAEARERLERASAEAREKSLAEKASMEARLRAERAAVERATAEARERAVEKAMAAKATSEARERAERSVSEKFSSASRDSGMRQSSSTSVSKVIFAYITLFIVIFYEVHVLQQQVNWMMNGRTCRTDDFKAQVLPVFQDIQILQLMVVSSYATEKFEEAEGESAQRCKAKLERHQRTVERAAKALEDKNMRDLLAQREKAERNRLAETLDADVKRWSSGKEGNLRALLSTLQYILGPDSGWQPIPLTDVITAVAVKKAYRKSTLCVHPDKLQQRGASIQQKYICEKVFDLLKTRQLEVSGLIPDVAGG
ncbi:hypothetical protein HHK36_031303 [Tetracentron sinense]|uniref:Auxilin-like protein 1 n=1 Tax=Tetracentron sinense TaxID=13715 RepID=A0A834YCM3_TETSI|nr:hypothetical protein HHK36_031303 [Tetracentron sinense]